MNTSRHRPAIAGILGVTLSAMLTLTSCSSHPDGWTVIWQDDFNTQELDPAVWSRTTRGKSDWQNTQSDDQRLVEIRDGLLVLRGMVNDNPLDSAEFITGGVWTKDLKPLGPGRIEIRARLHGARGAWPALWTMGFDTRKAGWPDGGEIDIMERLNSDSIAYQTLHTPYTLYVNTQDKHGGIGVIDPEDFNIYGVDIEKDSIVLHINGTPTLTYHRIPELENQGQYPFYGPQYLLMDMQLGGKWVGEVSREDLPVEMEIDWVRESVRKD